jgi:hypothetical protein
VEQATPPVEVWERRTGAALAALPGAPAYRRREPEKTLLHAVVRDRLEPFLAAARDRSPSGRGLPAHVERDLRAYLDCGILARGFARVRCPGCGFERLVAFSCKARSCSTCSPGPSSPGSAARRGGSEWPIRGPPAAPRSSGSGAPST